MVSSLFRAGYKVTVIDTTDHDWWKGKCLGRLGFFPSKYVTKIQPGERPLQVTHNLQVADGEEGLTLLRDQIVIQVRVGIVCFSAFIVVINALDPYTEGNSH